VPGSVSVRPECWQKLSCNRSVNRPNGFRWTNTIEEVQNRPRVGLVSFFIPFLFHSISSGHQPQRQSDEISIWKLPRFADNLKRRKMELSLGIGQNDSRRSGGIEVGDANRVGDESGSEFASCSLHLNASTAFWFVAAAAVLCWLRLLLVVVLRTGIPKSIRTDPMRTRTWP